MAFTQDWFSQNIPIWSRLLAGLRGRENVRVLEIGVFEGRSTCWLLENILTGPGATVDCIDTFEGSMEHAEMDLSSLRDRFEANISPWRERVGIHVGKSADILPGLSGPYDFLYIDGSHTAPDVLADAVLAWRLAAADAILIFDDYAWPRYRDQPWLHPKLAVDSFLACHAGWHEILEKGYQLAIRKLPEYSPPRAPRTTGQQGAPLSSLWGGSFGYS
jgi:predicted O-methyltransferase YrrM